MTCSGSAAPPRSSCRPFTPARAGLAHGMDRGAGRSAGGSCGSCGSCGSPAALRVPVRRASSVPHRLVVVVVAAVACPTGGVEGTGIETEAVGAGGVATSGVAGAGSASGRGGEPAAGAVCTSPPLPAPATPTPDPAPVLTAVTLSPGARACPGRRGAGAVGRRAGGWPGAGTCTATSITSIDGESAGVGGAGDGRSADATLLIR